MFLVELGDKAILAEEFEIVGFGDADKIFQFSLDLGVPVLVIVQKLRVQVVAEQGAAGGDDFTPVLLRMLFAVSGSTVLNFSRYLLCTV